jgi:hypothetical protein
MNNTFLSPSPRPSPLAGKISPLSLRERDGERVGSLGGEREKERKAGMTNVLRVRS